MNFMTDLKGAKLSKKYATIALNFIIIFFDSSVYDDGKCSISNSLRVDSSIQDVDEFITCVM